MKDEMKNMPSGSDPVVFRRKMEDYLGDRMSPEERNAFEREMQDDPFYSDAAEGIETSGKKELLSLEKEINKGLRKQLNRSKKKRKNLPDIKVPLVAVAIILLILIASYLVIRMFI
jgi:hypothetical protein